MGVQISVAANGRMVIPADVRKQLGLEKGGNVTLDLSEFGVMLTTPEQRVKRAQALYQRYSNGRRSTSVDDFIAQKRIDTETEQF